MNEPDSPSEAAGHARESVASTASWGAAVAPTERGAPGRGSRVARVYGGVQRKATDTAAAPVGAMIAAPSVAAAATAPPAQAGRFAGDDPFGMHLIDDRGGAPAVAARGVEGSGTALPFRAEIEQAAGRDLSGIEAHVGGAAAEACADLGATAFATGHHVGFASSPDLHTATHETVHVLQQQAGVQLRGGVGQVGDVYEQQADAAGDAIVRGESIAHLVPGPGRATASPGAVVQRDAAPAADAGAENTGPEAEFLRELRGDRIVFDPHPLRLEKGRPGTVRMLPMATRRLPSDAPRLPLYGKLMGKGGTSVDEGSSEWFPTMMMATPLTFAVPGPGHYRVELHVNAGRPGARLLTTWLSVARASEEAVAADEGERLQAAANADDGGDLPAPPVGTYRDMLAAVLAAQGLTQQGDRKSYRQAAQLLEAVSERLHAIYPALLDERAKLGYSRNAVDLRFGMARDELRGWTFKLHLGSSINTDPLVAAFQVGETEIKMATGERADLRDLKALDAAAVTTAKVTAVAAAAVVVAPIAASAIAAIGAEVAAGTLGNSLYIWAVANPTTALVLSETLIGMGIQIGEAGGPEEYFGNLQNNEDKAWLVFQVLMDLAQVRQGQLGDRGGGGVRPRGGGGGDGGGNEAPPPPRSRTGHADDPDQAPRASAAAGRSAARDTRAKVPQVEVESTPAIAIARSNEATGPFALRAASSLTTRQRTVHELLPQQGDMAKVKKRVVSMDDLRAIGQVTGDEYSMYTLGAQRLIIRGAGNKVVVPDQAFADALLAGEYGRWSGHTHPPGYSTRPGPADKPSIPQGQQRSAIWGDDGVAPFFRDDDAELAQRRADFEKQYGDQEGE